MQSERRIHLAESFDRGELQVVKEGIEESARSTAGLRSDESGSIECSLELAFT